MGVTVDRYAACVPAPDPTLPPPLDLYWVANMSRLRSEVFTTATFVYGAELADRLYQLLYEFDVEHGPQQKSSEEDRE